MCAEIRPFILPLPLSVSVSLCSRSLHGCTLGGAAGIAHTGTSLIEISIEALLIGGGKLLT